MSISAKFKCVSITDYAGAQTGSVNREVSLVAVYGTGEENKQWAMWTPCGTITMQITNPDAKFVIDQEYYLTFTPAEAKAIAA